MSDKVNLFLIGAQKSGSTALASLLWQHPSISVSEPKAPNFFNKRFKKTFQIVRYDEYKSCFDLNKEYLCDASDCYHADIEALIAIKEYNPKSRIIMIARDPFDMIESLHQHTLWAGYENETSLSKALELESKRKIGSRLPNKCFDSEYLMYTELCSIGNQVELLLSIFPRENLLFMSFENFTKNPNGAIDTISEWLGLPNCLIDVSKMERNKKVAQRFKMISKLNLAIPPNVKLVLKNIYSKLGGQPDGIMRRLNGIEVLNEKNKFVDIPPVVVECLNEQKIKFSKLTGVEL